jgi:hypothetical protein
MRSAGKARTALVGTLAHIGATVALGIISSAYKEKMLRDLEAMPKPIVDKRNAEAYFKDPKVRAAIRVIDLFDKNLDQLAIDLETHHETLKMGVTAEVARVAVSRMALSERHAFVLGMNDQLGTYCDELQTLADNVTASLALERRSLEAAKAARELVQILETGLVLDWLLKAGFSVEEISRIDANLRQYDARMRKLFAGLRTLNAKVATILSEAESMTSSVNKLSWQLFGEMYGEEMKRQETKRRAVHN